MAQYNPSRDVQRPTFSARAPTLGPNIPVCVKHSKLPLNSNPLHFFPKKRTLSIKIHSLEEYITCVVGQWGRNKSQTTGEIVRQPDHKYSVPANPRGRQQLLNVVNIFLLTRNNASST